MALQTIAYIGQKAKLRNAGLLGNDAIVATLQNLAFNEDKPSKLQPLDIALLTYLILRRAVDHEVFDSQDTLAKRLCAERKAIARSIKRLTRREWLSIRRRGKGKTLALIVDLDKLPAAQPVRQAISQQAKQLAVKYQQMLAKSGRRKFTKNWLPQQFPSAQAVINFCGGDAGRALHIVGFGVFESGHQKKARISMYHLKTIFPRVAGQWQQKYGNAYDKPSQSAPQTVEPPPQTEQAAPTAA